MDNENLVGLIKNDKIKLRQLGITFAQLKLFFDKIRKHVAYQKLFGNITPDNGCYIFNNKIYAHQTLWRGAEPCPFQSLYDKNYHGFEYGYCDWIFVNKNNVCFHIGDILFHEIAEHHFCQSPSSPSHVNIDELVKFFNISGDINYETTTEKIKYLYPMECNTYIAELSLSGKKSVIVVGKNKYEINDGYVKTTIFNGTNLLSAIDEYRFLPEKIQNYILHLDYKRTATPNDNPKITYYKKKNIRYDF